jgi:hypothetical protein
MPSQALNQYTILVIDEIARGKGNTYNGTRTRYEKTVFCGRKEYFAGFKGNGA